eukprot:g14228.t1
MDERRQSGIIIDSVRSQWLAAPVNINASIFLSQLQSHDHKRLAGALFNHDERKRKDGWVPVLVQGVLYSNALRLCGTCDVLWFHRTIGFVLKDLKCSKAYNPTATEQNKRHKQTKKFQETFGNDGSGVRDLPYDKGGFQLAAYAELLKEANYFATVVRMHNVQAASFSLEPKLQLLCLHDDYARQGFVREIPYNLNKVAFRQLLDAWSLKTNTGNQSMLDQLKQRCKEGNVPLSHPLVNFLKGAEKNKQILPDTRFENLQLLQSIDCEHQWVVTTSLCACEIKRRDERKAMQNSHAQQIWAASELFLSALQKQMEATNNINQ